MSNYRKYVQYLQGLTMSHIKCSTINQARQTRPNSGGVAEGHSRFDKGGVAIIFLLLRVKNRTF